MRAENSKYRIIECAAYPGKFNCQRYEGFTLSGHIWRDIHSFCEESTARLWLDQAEGRVPKTKRPARPSKWSKWR